MSKLIWLGPRESDIAYTGDFFDDSITLYGNKENSISFCSEKQCRINHNNVTSEQTDFMVKNEMRLLRDNTDVEFMSYNPNLIYDYGETILNHMVCVNDQKLMQLLDSKISFRKFATSLVPTLYSEVIYGKDCSIYNLEKRFPESNAWIIQSEIASGGYKTLILNKDNEAEIIPDLISDEKYLVSNYYRDNIPINIHAIIYEDEVVLTPGSIQVLKEDRNRLLYRGGDFVEYMNISEELRNQIKDNAMKLCKAIGSLGYRGVIGIDAMIVYNQILILEVNNRFQASSILLNKALQDAHLPSLQKLNYEAFHEKKSLLVSSEDIYNLPVPYSLYTFVDGDFQRHTVNIMRYYSSEKNIVELIGDGYDPSQDAEEEAYLYRVIFKTNIVSIVNNRSVNIHPNIESPSLTWYRGILEEHDIKKIKISLLNQGVILDNEVKLYMQDHGGIRPGTYFAVDLVLDEKYIVNSPLFVKFAALSPYHVVIDDCILYLEYYGFKICCVRIDFADEIAERCISSGIEVKKICFLATDRLRVQNSDFCTFKENDVPCRFCEVQYKTDAFGVSNICEALDFYFDKDAPSFRHILIGGLSNTIGQEKFNICVIIKHIRKYSNMPIYLMCIPCSNLNDIEEYVKLGVTEIGFNIEIFDRNLAELYMPGKGKIPLEAYQASMEKAVSLLGRNGAVRSAFVVGLECMGSLLEGVEYVCKLGVAPIFSVFRPIPGTDMENVNPPSNEWLLEAYEKAEIICNRYGLHLGPSCASCQNNTLAFEELKDEESTNEFHLSKMESFS